MKNFVSISALGFLLVACSQRSLSPADTITTAIGSPIQSLNPLYSTDADTQHVEELVHSALVNLGMDLLPEPYLAKSFRVINDTTLEFTLRHGCVFPDGHPLSLDDIEYSIHYYQDPLLKSTVSQNFKHITRMERISAETFRLHTDKTTPSLLSDLALLKIFPANTPKTALTMLPGIGPYQVKKFTTQEISLERTDTKCLPIPAMPKIVIKVVRDDLSRYLKLKRGELDIVLNEMNLRKLQYIEENHDKDLKVLSAPGIGYSYIGVNVTNPKLSDPRVRRALALSFDIPAFIQYKNAGMATQTRNILSDSNYYANLKVPIVERNLKEAKRLLDEAGYYNGENHKPQLHIIFASTNNSFAVENAAVFAAQAKEAGFDLQNRAYEWGIFYSDVKKRNTELYLLRWVGVTDPSIYFDAFHSGTVTQNNRSGYTNPELDHWLDLGQSTMDRAKRKQAFDQAQLIIARDLPLIGLWSPSNAVAYRKEISGVKLHPTGSWSTFLSLKKTVEPIHE